MVKEKKLAISVKNVGLAYQRRVGFFRKEAFWPLKNLSFDIYHGETLGIIGRNGVGKSTLLRLLAGITAPDRGKIINHGITASLLSLQAGFLGRLTGRENVLLGGMILGLSKSDIIQQMDEIESYADIGVFFDQPVQGYSSGMRARVGFSLAIHAKTDVILLDEVLGVGDVDFRLKSSATIRGKIQSNKTVVLVSHQNGLVLDVCDRAIWIEQGCIKTEGNPKEVLDKYMKKQQEKTKYGE